METKGFEKMHDKAWPRWAAVCLVAILSGFSIYFSAHILTQPKEKLGPFVVEHDRSFMATHLPRPSEDGLNQQPVLTQPDFVADYVLPRSSNGFAPVITRLITQQPIVFLGIDDGEYKDPSVVQIMKDNNIKASLFLSKTFISSNPDFFKQLVDAGSVIENHTLNHDTQMVKDEDYAQQKAQICGMSDYELQHYGRRPTLFRPPGGAYSDTMRKATYDCGMKAVVTWIAKANGGAMQYQIGNKLRPGDIVLMHFRPEFKQDMQAFVAAEKAAGLHTELIEDALKS